MKHTKAPWVARKAYGSEEIFADSVTWMVNGGDLTNKETRTYIAECGAHDKSEANANLIAAAPDLLESCKEMKNHFVHITQDSESWEIIERAKQAITKAEGKE